jgi:hypothetical protein
MKTLAQKFGFTDSVWSYGEAAGVVATKPYLELLAKGQFPFSGNADVNLSVHDAMHSIAFAVLNVTAGGRSVLKAAKSRNDIILRIEKRLQTEVSNDYAHFFLERISTYISSDPMERTMLLTILLTGNYDYFSALRVRSNEGQPFFSKQNPTTTKKRILELLRLFNYGTLTFEQALN